MKKKYIVYIHTNLINNKKYIGITCQEPQKRWGKDGYGYREQLKFYNAIQKYGWNNFSHEIVAKNLTNEEALELESEYISYYNSINNGYNILEKGIKSYHKTKPVYNLTNQIKYNSIIEAANSINTVPYNIIKNCKGKSGPVKGIQWAYWDEKNNVYIQPEIFIPKPKSNSKKIICLETKIIYNSILEASKDIAVDDTDLRKVIRGIRNGIKGFHFIELKDLNKYNVVNTLLKPNGFKSRIYCQETNQIFETLNEAAAFCNKTNQSVMKNCQGKLKQCGGYHFNYLSDLSEEKILQIYGYDNAFFEQFQGEMEEDND